MRESETVKTRARDNNRDGGTRYAARARNGFLVGGKMEGEERVVSGARASSAGSGFVALQPRGQCRGAGLRRVPSERAWRRAMAPRKRKEGISHFGGQFWHGEGAGNDRHETELLLLPRTVRDARGRSRTRSRRNSTKNFSPGRG